MSDDGNDDYKVGYQRPPKNTRFKKGQSGNPFGAGSRSTKSMDATESLLKALRKKRRVAIDGIVYQMDVVELAAAQLGAKVAKGDLGAIKFVYQIFGSQKKHGRHQLPSWEGQYTAKEELQRKLAKMFAGMELKKELQAAGRIPPDDERVGDKAYSAQQKKSEDEEKK